MLMFIFRLAVAIFAVVLILFGFVVMVAPTPFGIILVILGVLLFATALPEIFRRVRKRWKWLDRRLDAFQERAPRWLAKRLKLSDPQDDEDEADRESSDSENSNKKNNKTNGRKNRR